MSKIRTLLPTMLALAEDRSEHSRVQLAGMLADSYLATDTGLSLREQEMVNELIDQLMMNCTPQIRAQLVARFVDAARMPRSIAASLAQEPIEVARNILICNQALMDNDLIQVVEQKGRDHALAVAARREISAAVADALVTTGDIRVMQVVAENLGARLSQQAVAAVADAARYVAALRAPILQRPEITAATAIKLYWWVEQDLRRYSMKRFGLTSGQIDQALSSTLTTFLNDHALEKNNDEIMEQVASWMESHQALTPQILPHVLRMGHFRLFNILLARLTRLSLSLVDTIVGEIGGRGLASICKAIGIDKPGFVSLFLLSRGSRPGEQIVHPRELSNALATFDRLAPTVARDLLHSWTVNPDYFASPDVDIATEERMYC